MRINFLDAIFSYYCCNVYSIDGKDISVFYVGMMKTTTTETATAAAKSYSILLWM
jgi:hypothetical protein